MHFVGIDSAPPTRRSRSRRRDGAVPLAPGAPHWRTVLYFEPGGALTAGAPAIARYLETGGEGRLVQSIKSHLASADVLADEIFGRRWALEDMIAAYLGGSAPRRRSISAARGVVGRPVRYWGAETGRG